MKEEQIRIEKAAQEKKEAKEKAEREAKEAAAAKVKAEEAAKRNEGEKKKGEQVRAIKVHCGNIEHCVIFLGIICGLRSCSERG